ncbi:MAG: hypothetical protein GY847_01800 [Proteobacteria bacterium]|nr:hypothetical protein [Pseudomonadota bacterium]
MKDSGRKTNEELAELIDAMGYLFDRWQDEKEYEDFSEYIKMAKKALPDDCTFVSMKKRPFRIYFSDTTREYYLNVTSRKMDLMSRIID